ncbi:hypothetical protein LTR85_000835 [Meristemomyces frigidus]|nr:hypothetical protein LTR85_000835 [Meristemomyces frigidus]
MEPSPPSSSDSVTGFTIPILPRLGRIGFTKRSDAPTTETSSLDTGYDTARSEAHQGCEGDGSAKGVLSETQQPSQQSPCAVQGDSQEEVGKAVSGNYGCPKKQTPSTLWRTSNAPLPRVDGVIDRTTFSARELGTAQGLLEFHDRARVYATPSNDPSSAHDHASTPSEDTKAGGAEATPEQAVLQEQHRPSTPAATAHSQPKPTTAKPSWTQRKRLYAKGPIRESAVRETAQPEPRRLTALPPVATPKRQPPPNIPADFHERARRNWNVPGFNAYLRGLGDEAVWDADYEQARAVSQRAAARR